MRKMRAEVLFLLCLAAMPTQAARAHHPSPGFGSDTAGPVATIAAAPMERNRWSFGIRTDFQAFDTISDAELESLAASGTETHSMDDQTNIFLSAAYGLTDDLTVGMHIPYVIRRGIREGHMEGGVPEVHDHGDSEGIGDLSLLGQYRFLRAEKAGADVSLLFGLKAPTGDTRAADRDGVRFETEFQPGSGSWDPLIGAAAGRRLGRASLDASVLYAVAAKGSQDTDLGDALHFGASIAWQYTPAHDHSSRSADSRPEPSGAPRASGQEERHSHLSLDFILEATGEWRGKQSVAGTRDPNSGGTLVLLAPGLRVNLFDRLTAFVSAGFPLIQELNGTQHETRRRLIFGITAGL